MTNEDSIKKTATMNDEDLIPTDLYKRLREAEPLQSRKMEGSR
jgi:hypothetical protein